MKPPHARWKKVLSRLVRHLWYTQAYVNTNPVHGENSGLRIDLRCRWVPSTCVLFVLPPLCLQHQHKSESKAGNQVTHIVTVVCAVVKAERCRKNLTCGFSKVEIWLEVEACSLFLENFQMRVIQCPRLCCRKRKEETKDKGNVKTFIEINNWRNWVQSFGVFAYRCTKKEEAVNSLKRYRFLPFLVSPSGPHITEVSTQTMQSGQVTRCFPSCSWVVELK